MTTLATTALVFSTLSPQRIEDARGFLLAMPKICRGALVEVDLGYRQRARLLVALARTSGASEDAGRRLAFWCGVSGGRGRRFADISELARGSYRRVLVGCDRRVEGVPGPLLVDAVESLSSSLGWIGAAPRYEPMVSLDLDHPESYDGLRYDAVGGVLFFPAPLSPPIGDALPILVRASASESVVVARVIGHEAPGESGSGMPGGFRARIVDAPPEAIGLLAAWERRTAGKRRSAPRFAYRAPILAKPVAEETCEAVDPEMEFANISQGGAHVRTRSPPAPGTRLRLEFPLPSGDRVELDARVMWRDVGGMGVKFAAGAELNALIGKSLAVLASRPRRALVIDDDALAREVVGDALAEHGYEVLKASDGAAGLRLLTDELLSLDAVVTDLTMPNMDGEAFVRAVRDAGGEQDLAIVVATARGDAVTRTRLEANGVDAVVEKRAGGDVIAAAVVAAVKARAGATASFGR